jgi:hypothetical protein
VSSFTDSVFRLETLQEYRVPQEAHRFQAFLPGEKLERYEPNPLVTRAVAVGKWVDRVHVVDLPPTPYLR